MLAAAAGSETGRDSRQPGWVAPRLRVATHVGIRVHARAVARQRIGGEKHACHRVIVPGSIVIQLGQRVVILAGEAPGRVERTCRVACVAIRTVELVALERGAVGGVGEAG